MSLGSILIIISIVHAYVFAVLFFSNRKYSSLILGAYMINVGLQYFLFANISIFKIEQLYILFYFLINPLSLASIPIIYLYVKHMTSVESFAVKKELLHFLPSAIIFLITSALIVSLPEELRYKLLENKRSDEIQLVAIFYTFITSIFILLIQVVYYSIKMFKMLNSHKNNVLHIYSNTDKVSLVWLKWFVIVFLSYYIFDFGTVLINGVSISETFYFSLVSLHVFFVGYMGFKQPEIFIKTSDFHDQLEDFSPSNDIVTDNEYLAQREPKEIISEKLDNRQGIKISEELVSYTVDKLKEIMENEKLYLNPDLSLYDLSVKLKINRNYLSQIINDRFETNFYNFINNYRIETAKKMLSNPDYNYLSIEGIAKESGFKSRNVFYPIFKKFVGETPNDYKKRVQQN